MYNYLTLYFVLEYYFYFHRIPIGSILNFVLNLTVYNIASKSINQKPVFLSNNVPYEAVLESAVNSQSLPFLKNRYGLESILKWIFDCQVIIYIKNIINLNEIIYLISPFVISIVSVWRHLWTNQWQFYATKIHTKKICHRKYDS